MSDWDDLRERLEKADRTLIELSLDYEPHERARHRLEAKAEGVRLALSYMREYEDTAPPERAAKVP